MTPKLKRMPNSARMVRVLAVIAVGAALLSVLLNGRTPTHAQTVAVVTGQSEENAHPKYKSAREAYERGRKANRDGDVATAIPALRYAAREGIFLAKFYLAETLADPNHHLSNPSEAFKLYAEIIDENDNVDPKYDYKAKFVARARVMKSRFLSGKLRAEGVTRNENDARRLLGYAATYLDDPSAQYEYARMLLEGRGGGQNIRGGKHYLSLLSRKGHAGAQAYLADLFWTGTYVKQHAGYALALSTLAVRNSPKNDDRIWIEELHHEIYCAVDPETHVIAGKLIERWLSRYPTERIYARGRSNLLADVHVRWACANGNDIIHGAGVQELADNGATDEAGSDGDSDTRKKTAPPSPRPDGKWADHNRLREMHGSVLGFSRRGNSKDTE